MGIGNRPRRELDEPARGVENDSNGQDDRPDQQHTTLLTSRQFLSLAVLHADVSEHAECDEQTGEVRDSEPLGSSHPASSREVVVARWLRVDVALADRHSARWKSLWLLLRRVTWCKVEHPSPERVTREGCSLEKGLVYLESP